MKLAFGCILLSLISFISSIFGYRQHDRKTHQDVQTGHERHRPSNRPENLRYWKKSDYDLKKSSTNNLGTFNLQFKNKYSGEIDIEKKKPNRNTYGSIHRIKNPKLRNIF
ncbi:unnamed protein product [Phyllotreta striolata]|uniref:Uncharacterized protein n=1 Tax=Phyllotreta striolata TaxID=444603 RepID=A0A9N9TF98_PHYSR|nr:unnamed protein product [Phyllotreta striolata]